jgi:hypothetical protein
VSEQDAFLKEIQTVLQDPAEISVEMPTGPVSGTTRTPVPVHVIRRAVGRNTGSGPRADAIKATLQAFALPISASGHPVGRPPVHDDAHYREVAQIYARAWRNGDRHPTLTVATEKAVSRTTAAKWVSAARQRGYLGPTQARRAGGIIPGST